MYLSPSTTHRNNFPRFLSAICLTLAACGSSNTIEDDGRSVDATLSIADAGGHIDSAGALDASEPSDAGNEIDSSSMGTDSGGGFDAAAADATIRDAATAIDASAIRDATVPPDAGDPNEISCRLMDVACEQVEPSCNDGETPSVRGDCYGPCVPYEMCRCSDADDCPNRDQYTCHRFSGRCGPYL